MKEEFMTEVVQQMLPYLDNAQLKQLYLKYFFTSWEGYNAIVSRSSGSVQVNISRRNVIENIPLSLPPLDTQQKVVGVLSAIDEKIRENAEINSYYV